MFTLYFDMTRNCFAYGCDAGNVKAKIFNKGLGIRNRSLFFTIRWVYVPC